MGFVTRLQRLLHSPVYDPLFQPDYLDASAVPSFGASAPAAPSPLPHPFCGNREGWGPLSPFRYDFTPCFLDVWIATVALLVGVLGGAGALLYLRRQGKAAAGAPVPRNWHFWAKLAVVGALGAVTILQGALQIHALGPGVWYADFRFWTTVALLLSLSVVGAAQALEHGRSRTPNAVVLFYWLLLPLAMAVKLRSLVAQDAPRLRPAYFGSFCAATGLALVEFGLEYFVPKKQSAYDALGSADECPVEYADVFSRLTFGWMTPMMRFGYRHFLTQDDLWNLRAGDTARVTGVALEETWARELDRPRGPSLWWAMFRAFGGPYLGGAVVKTVSDVLQFAQPQLLRLLIEWVDSQQHDAVPQPAIRGVALALCMFAVSVVQSLALHQYFQTSFETGMRLRAALTAAIYRKALRLSSEGRAAKSTGDIVNYMAVDTQRLQDLTQYGQQLWSAPFQIALCMASLYQLLGPSMLAGVGVMVLSIPVNAALARYMRRLQKVQMKNKDARTRLMTDILNNMKTIKLYAWGRAFLARLGAIRNDQELRTLRTIGAFSAVQNFTWAGTPIAVSTLTFAVFVLTGDRPLTVALVFPALTLFNMLNFPLLILPMVITAIIEATVAVGRLTAYLTAAELQPDAVERLPAAAATGDESVRVRAATFTWDHTAAPPKPCLADIAFSARKGELSCVIGRVGAGKSSFLSALLGDLHKLSGSVRVRGAVAYAAQAPWIMNASVRENVVFGHRWDAAFYARAVAACALPADFAQLPDGDRTEVGEKGIALSGGQKARLALARAVYARADVYVLDDVLAAVDQHVGRHLVRHVLGPQGLLAGKTRILATNALPVLEHADYITYLKDSRIAEHGTYAELMAAPDSALAEVVRSARTDAPTPGDATPSDASRATGTTAVDPDGSPPPPADTGAEDAPTSTATPADGDAEAETAPLLEEDGYADDDDTITALEEAHDHVDALVPLRPAQSHSEAAAAGSPGATRSMLSARSAGGGSLRRASTASFRGPHGRLLDDEEGPVVTKRASRTGGGGTDGAADDNADADADAADGEGRGERELKTRQLAEASAQGKVRWAVYVEYAKASNAWAVGAYMVALLAAQTAQIGANLWLKRWAEANTRAAANPAVGRYVGIYAAFGLASAALMVLQTLILWIFCSIEASRKLHERMAVAIFRSPMSFFETNPLGRILNRFSSDIYKVDEVLARTFNMLFVNGARAFFTLGLIVASTPLFAILIVPIGGLYYYIQRYYLRTSRELKRLDSVSKSPIYAHFQETLGGLGTVRAYRQQRRFALENEWRVDANLRTYYPSVSANRWLAVRLEFIGSLVILAAAAFAIVAVSGGGGPSAGMVGLAMSYALQITQSLNWIVRQTVEVETNIVSVERCLEYARLPSEAPEVLPHHRPKASWPARGAVTFENYSTRYRPGLDLVLRDVDLSVRAREKVGVVGRTGAGKSSLTLALFRIVEPAAGRIAIDDVDTASVGLLDVRSRLAIIPQDAALFEGSVRDNLDPGRVHDDAELWSVLGHARLRDHVAQMDGELEARIHEGGSNLSQGQRQLVSLARALLTPTSILVLDEATAAVDVQTDALLQQTLRGALFRDRTIITIAHRINTILDSDRIVVLDQGRVAEFDTPAALVRRGGLFRELVREAGLLETFEQQLPQQ